MQNPQTQREHFPPLPRDSAPLWAGVIGVPAVWGIMLQAVYAFATHACVHQEFWVIHVLQIIGLVLAALGGFICFSYWHREGDDMKDRTRFLASWGMMISALFFITILSQTIAGWMLNACAT